MENEPHSTVELPDIQDYQEQTENDTPTDPARIQPNSKALLLLKMKEDRRISQSNVDGLVADFTVFLQEEILSLKEDVISCIHHGKDLNDSISKVNVLFSQKLAASPFQGLETAYLQRKYFIDHFHLVVRHSDIISPPPPPSLPLHLSLSPSPSLPSSVQFHLHYIGTSGKKAWPNDMPHM